MQFNIETKSICNPEDAFTEKPFEITIKDNEFDIYITSKQLTLYEFEELNKDFYKYAKETIFYKSEAFSILKKLLKYSDIKGFSFYNAIKLFIKSFRINKLKYIFNIKAFYVSSLISFDSLLDWFYHYMQYNISVKKKLSDILAHGIREYPEKPMSLASIEPSSSIADFHSLGELL